MRGRRFPRNLAAWLLIALLAFYFFFPFASIFRFSFQQVPTALLTWDNLFDRWTLKFLGDAFAHPEFWPSVVLSFLITGGAIALTVGLMLPTAMWVHLRVPQARSLVETLTVLPYVVPPIALVVGVFGAYKDTVPWFFNSRWVLIPFYAILSMPFTYRSLDAGLRAIQLRTLVDASRSLGAGWGTTMFRVLVPSLRTALLSAIFLTITVALGEYTMASIMGFSFPGRQTLPVFTAVFGQGSGRAAYALGLVTLMTSTVLLAALTFITGRRAASARGI